MTTKQKHAHRFKRHVYKSTGHAIFHCTLPDCNFKIDVPLSLGKRSICNRCGGEFLIDERSIRQARPHCQACTKRKGTVNADASKSVSREMAASSVSSLRERLSSISSVALASDEDTDEVL